MSFQKDMNIKSVSSTNFCATYQSKTEILKYDPKSKEYKSEPAYFVKFDCQNKKDLKALKKIDKKWKAPYTNTIYMGAKSVKECGEEFLSIYGLTTQKENYDKLKANLLEGIAMTTPLKYEENGIYLVNLTRKKNYTQYKHVGTGVLNSLKKEFNIIKLISKNETENFYIKHNGFRIENDKDGNESILVWSRDRGS